MQRSSALRHLGAVITVAALGTGAASAQDTVARGAALGNAPAIELQEVLESADRYAERLLTLEGEVKRVCEVKGCWMELVNPGADRGIRVTFKDYAFFVPTDSMGWRARLEGRLETNLFSKADADHLIAEGVALIRNDDGTATEVSFVAQGLELYR